MIDNLKCFPIKVKMKTAEDEKKNFEKKFDVVVLFSDQVKEMVFQLFNKGVVISKSKLDIFENIKKSDMIEFSHNVKLKKNIFVCREESFKELFKIFWSHIYCDQIGGVEMLRFLMGELIG